jgi:hypothetical protein
MLFMGTFCDLSVTQAGRAKNRWVAISRNNPLYVSASSGMEIAPFLSSLNLSPKASHLGKNVVIDKTVAYDISIKVNVGSASSPTYATENFYISTRSYLPIKIVLTKKEFNTVMSFSDWNKASTIKVPTKWVSINKL